MGEIIKKYKKTPIGFDVELNAPQEDGADYVIHIQNEKGRIALSKNEFVELALLFYSAKKKMLCYKKIK